ncbi:MAG TPA: DUF115 domain-containing protein [Ignisphaera sp.]|nr:DUF115 domain-containing protein [Ignisphaera sp.]
MSTVSAIWWMRYKYIVSKLGIDESLDRFATRMLSEFLRSFQLDVHSILHYLEKALRGAVTIVMGAGPSLEHQVRELHALKILNECCIVVADGVARLLRIYNVIPTAIVTDLDGEDGSILELGLRGAVVALHAHGDNIDRIIEWIPRARRYGVRVLGTTQVEPTDNVINIGGFTDGDRALLLTLRFHPRAVILVGMDFGDVVGPYSKPWLHRAMKADERKRVKLDIAKQIIEDAVCSSRSEVYTLSSTDLNCVHRADIHEVLRLLRS